MVAVSRVHFISKQWAFSLVQRLVFMSNILLAFLPIHQVTADFICPNSSMHGYVFTGFRYPRDNYLSRNLSAFSFRGSFHSSKKKRLDSILLASNGKQSMNSSGRKGSSRQSTSLTKQSNNNRAVHRQLQSGEKTKVILYHKPPNIVTSHSNEDAAPQSMKGSQETQTRRRTVYEDIYSMKGFVPSPSKRQKLTSESSTPNSFEKITGIKSKLHAVGRLDAATTGLLLLTNDGGLVHHITNPTSSDSNFLHSHQRIQKTYEALIMGYHLLPPRNNSNEFGANESDSSNITISSNSNEVINSSTYPLLALLEDGVTLPQKYGGHTTRPVDAISILSHPSRSTTQISITISEGKNRQIRRLFHAIGSGVMKLHRVSVGNLNLGGLISKYENDSSTEPAGSHSWDYLEEGGWRLLTEDEIERGLGWKCRYMREDSDVTTPNQRNRGGHRTHLEQIKKRSRQKSITQKRKGRRQ